MKVQRTFAHHKIALMAATEQCEVIPHVRYRGALHLTRDTNTQEGDHQLLYRQKNTNIIMPPLDRDVKHLGQRDESWYNRHDAVFPRPFYLMASESGSPCADNTVPITFSSSSVPTSC